MKKNIKNHNTVIVDENIIKQLKEIARKRKKPFRKIFNDYLSLLKEFELSNKKLKLIIRKFKYKKFSDENIYLYNYGKNGELGLKFLCHYNLEIFNKIPKREVAIVSGFGPTNPPTAGTLSSILRVIELQKHTNIYTHIIISELGALNSRNRSLNELIQNAHQFISFIKKLGFDEKNGEIRTHNFHDHARIFSLVSSVLTIKDLFKNLEVTYDTYRRLKLLGNDFSRMISRAYTITDIILPIIRDKKQGVIVPVGIEEHHHPYLARIVLERMKVKYRTLVRQDADVGALYGKIIKGFFPYLKMSKSIPESAINLGDSVIELRRKILDCGEKNEEVILQMMLLASNWDYKKLIEAQNAFQNLRIDYNQWKKFKYEYLKFFINIKKLWEEAKPRNKIDIYKEIFKYDV